MTVAALYVEENGVYYGLPDVDPWPASRDARLYTGPHPVVAHPPCERWGSFYSGGPLLVKQGKAKKLGDDGGCFEAAVRAVRDNGGVLEHPAYSRAWKVFYLARPFPGGGWRGSRDGGWTCEVDQGKYGHSAPKKTWLFYVGESFPPSLAWGPSRAVGRVSGRHRHRAGDKRMPDAERRATPPAFRDLLLSIARSSRGQEQAA